MTAKTKTAQITDPTQPQADKVYLYVGTRTNHRPDSYGYVTVEPCRIDKDGQPRFFDRNATTSPEEEYIDGRYFVGGLTALVFVVADWPANHFEVGFEAVGGTLMKARQAQAIDKTLAWVERRTDKLSQEKGYTRNAAEDFARFAEAIGAAGVLVNDPETARRVSYRTEYDWSVETDVAKVVTEKIASVQEALRRGY